jgi:energy-coupling factor transporter ATP-binding protein EcfA2
MSNMTPIKISRIRLLNVAGYKSVTWDRIEPDLNFLIGRNGAGKSTILQALSVILNFISGRRTEDLFTRTYPAGEIEIEMNTGDKSRFSFRDTRISRSNRYKETSFKILQFVENRQPKNSVGDVRAELRQHPNGRYPNAISELKFLLSSSESNQGLARQVLDICKRITFSENLQDWNWIEMAIKERSPHKARPTSCGQFDIVAVALDLVKLKNSLKTDTEPVFILLDNPETYLHPACQEPMLNIFQEMIPQAQIFISSHSLKLLCHRKPKSVFWLSRESQDEYGKVNIQSIRELEEGARIAFYELYGDDLSSAVLTLLSAFESPEYYKFLCDCERPPKAELRNNPALDRQMQEIRYKLYNHPDCWTIFDCGAGNGDLIAALLAWGATDSRTTYVAYTAETSPHLHKRIEEAKKSGKISLDSKLVDSLSDAPSDCDVIVLCNVCHEISLPDLPVILARLLTQHLRVSDTSKIVIHEVDTLHFGEARFIMWNLQDYQHIFGQIRGIRVQLERKNLPGGVPLDTTTIFGISGQMALYDDIKDRLIKGFQERLPDKKDKCLAEIEELLRPNSRKSSGLEEALRQRRVAFLSAQVANICLLERQLQCQ